MQTSLITVPKAGRGKHRAEAFGITRENVTVRSPAAWSTSHLIIFNKYAQRKNLVLYTLAGGSFSGPWTPQHVSCP